MNCMYDEEEGNFSLDMIMHEPALQHHRIKEENKTEETNNKADRIPIGSRIKTKKKGKKLILKKKKENSLSIKFLNNILGENIREKKSKENYNDSKVYECHHPLCEKLFLDRNSYRKHLITHGEKQVNKNILNF